MTDNAKTTAETPRFRTGFKDRDAALRWAASKARKNSTLTEIDGVYVVEWDANPLPEGFRQ